MGLIRMEPFLFSIPTFAYIFPPLFPNDQFDNLSFLELQIQLHSWKFLTFYKIYGIESANIVLGFQGEWWWITDGK